MISRVALAAPRRIATVAARLVILFIFGTYFVHFYFAVINCIILDPCRCPSATGISTPLPSSSVPELLLSESPDLEPESEPCSDPSSSDMPETHPSRRSSSRAYHLLIIIFNYLFQLRHFGIRSVRGYGSFLPHGGVLDPLRPLSVGLSSSQFIQGHTRREYESPLIYCKPVT